MKERECCVAMVCVYVAFCSVEVQGIELLKNLV